MTYISRDPFARQELHRETVIPATGRTCDWCGGLNARGRLYRYRLETDGGSIYRDAKLFCSISCRRSFNF